MQATMTAREAKEFLVRRISSQAEQDGVPLSDVERKIMYFSESAWTLPDMAKVSEEFDREYSQGEFEQKIAGLVRNIRTAFLEDAASKGSWEDAVIALRGEDHYLLVLVDGESRAKPARPRGDFLRLILTAFAIVCVGLLAMFLFGSRR